MSGIETGKEPTNIEEGLPDALFFVIRIVDRHFEDIIHFLAIGIAPKEYSVQQKKELVVCATSFSVITGHLYKMGDDEILLRYVIEFERGQILIEAHGVAMGVNYARCVTAKKFISALLWWPTLH